MAFAPQTIQVKYGPGGLLASAVAAQAAQQGNQLNAARDWQFIQNRLDYAQHQQDAADAMNANRLQQAAQAFTPQASPRIPNPADTALKNAYLTGAAGELSPEAHAALQPLLQNAGVNAEQFKNVLGSNVANFQKNKIEQDAQVQLAQKREYLKSVLPQLMDQRDAASLASAIEDPKFTMAQLHAATTGIFRAQEEKKAADMKRQQQEQDLAKRQAEQEKMALQKAKLKQEFEARRAERDRLKAQAEQITKEMGGIASDFEKNAGMGAIGGVKPAQLNPIQPNNFATAGDVISNLTGSPTPKSLTSEIAPAVQPGNVAQRQAYMEYQRRKQQLLELARRSAEVMQGVPQNPSDDETAMKLLHAPEDNTQSAVQGESQPVQVNTPEEAMQLPSGTAFVTPDGRLKVRP